MSRFLKLKSVIINTSRISTIWFNKESVPKKITINLIQHDLSGFFFCGSGSVSTTDLSFKICEKEDPQDFVTVSNWIDKLNT
jgi:hypothetical protein